MDNSEESDDDLTQDEITEFLNTYSAGVGIHTSGKDDLPGVPDTPWLVRTRWQLHFQTCDLAAIADQTKHPGPQDENDIDIILSIIVHATRSYFEHALNVAAPAHIHFFAGLEVFPVQIPRLPPSDLCKIIVPSNDMFATGLVCYAFCVGRPSRTRALINFST